MVPPKCSMKCLNTAFEDQRHYPRTTNCSTFWNLEDSWFGPWRCVLLGEWSNCKQLDLVHKKLVQDLKSKCKVDMDESLLKVILGGSKYAFEGGAYVSQLCFKKGCYIGKAGCSEEEKCLTSPGEYNGIEKQSELAFQLIHEAVNELDGLCSVNREPIILVLDFEVQVLRNWEKLNLQGRLCRNFGRKSRFLVCGPDIGVMSEIFTGFVSSFEKFGAGPVNS